MMEWIASIPVWLLCLLIFGLRVCDVTLGTVRTVAIVKGYLSAAVVLGFFEVLIWILAVSQVIVRINESIFLGIAFAGGFAAGNAVGILVERHVGGPDPLGGSRPDDRRGHPAGWTRRFDLRRRR